MESGNAVLTTIQSSDDGRALRYLKERQKNREEIDKKKAELAKIPLCKTKAGPKEVMLGTRG